MLGHEFWKPCRKKSLGQKFDTPSDGTDGFWVRFCSMFSGASCSRDVGVAYEYEQGYKGPPQHANHWTEHHTRTYTTGASPHSSRSYHMPRESLLFDVNSAARWIMIYDRLCGKRSQRGLLQSSLLLMPEQNSKEIRTSFGRRALWTPYHVHH